MIRAAAALVALAALASCPRAEHRTVTVAAPDLETAAILRGLVRDPAESDPVGLFARDTDRVCIVPDGGGYRLGAYTYFADGIGCTGRGTARRSGERLTVDLGGGCSFDASYTGDRVTFPATIPAACSGMCTRRATFAALSVDRLSESRGEAAAMRDATGGRLCS